MAIGGLLLQALFRPIRKIGPIEAMVTVEEDHYDEAMITDHPVELGAQVSDHMIMLPAELRLTVGWSKSPNLTKAGLESLASIPGDLIAAVSNSGLLSEGGGSLDYLQLMYARLRGLQQSRIPMMIYTGKRRYKNMVIRSIHTVTNRDTENALLIDVTCREVLITQTRRTGGDNSKQAAPQETGWQIQMGAVTPVPSTIPPSGFAGK